VHVTLPRTSSKYRRNAQTCAAAAPAAAVHFCLQPERQTLVRATLARFVQKGATLSLGAVIMQYNALLLQA
jgi:hypothetical protein